MCDFQLRNVITSSSEIPIRVFLDSMEIPLSKVSNQVSLDGSGFQSRPEMDVPKNKVGCLGEAV